MQSKDIRKKFLDYFKKRNHVIVPSSSLIPDDPSVLLTSAGMQQFKPYYTGDADAEEDFGGKNTASIQKCFRTSDIDEVGDEDHLTFFEMMGNFSFGGYFKERAIKYAHDFITEEMGLKVDYVTVFDPNKVPDGDWRKNVPLDKESIAIWKNIGIPKTKIKHDGVDVFWGPTGIEGPCGPTTEIYVGGVEIWNIVFNEFYCSQDKKLEKLKTPGVDTGMGLERLAMAVQKTLTIFETDLFAPIIEMLPSELSEKEKRVIADHMRGIAFLISDGVRPSNKETGYVLRRLIRRAVMFEEKGVETGKLLRKVVDKYDDFYGNLDNNVIQKIFVDEAIKFSRTLKNGLNELEKLEKVGTKEAFNLYQSFGLPYEVIKDVAKNKAGELNREEFDKLFEEHQGISRAGADKKFKGGLVDHSEETTKLHTAHHLLLKALQIVLGDHVKQRGSNITSDRLRIDFLHDKKMTDEQKQEVERIVNEKIFEDLPVIKSEMPSEEAEKLGAEQEFGQKYPERVSVYSIGPKDATQDDPKFSEAFSIEFCGGPHVFRTGEIGSFKIKKEESSSADIRRIKAVIK